MATEQRNESIWNDSAEGARGDPRRPALDRDLAVDVCVIGAGIAGLSTALLLAKEGRSVAVLDRGGIGQGETGRTTAHLSNAIDDRYVDVERLHGREGARRVAASHAAAIDCIENIAREEGIHCDFQRVVGYLFAAADDDTGLLERERDAAVRAGVRGVEFVASAALNGRSLGPCLRFPNQAQFHPLRYVAGLARGIEGRGGLIFNDTTVASVEGGMRAKVTTANGPSVAAAAVVVATNVPINDRVVIHTKQAAYRSYAIALQIPAGQIARALYWDTADPYHYVRTAPMSDAFDVLIVGGEDHKTGQADDADERYARLETWTRGLLGTTGEVVRRWSGQIIETIDDLAFIGRNPADEDNVYVVTGDSGHGMTHGTIAGMLLCDLIQGRRNDWAQLYDPSRKTLRAAPAFVRENVNVARQYATWLSSGDADSIADIPRGSGGIVREGLKHIAVYREGDGSVRTYDATCPHLGCVVHWNTAERTFDCPCHGSRFDTSGGVINGPANRGLEPIEAQRGEQPKRRMGE